MLPFKHLIPIDRTSDTALYQQIASGMIEAIQNGVIESGSTLPGTRTLAKTLNVHRKTIISAYDELYAQSWIDINPRKSVRVVDLLPDLGPRSWEDGQETRQMDHFSQAVMSTEEPIAVHRIVVNDGYPDIRLFPHELITREYRFSLKQKALQSMEDPLLPWGAASLRDTLVNYLHKTRGISTRLDHIMVTNGAQMGIYLTAISLLKKGDHVVVGTPGYHLADEVFGHVDAILHQIPVDQDGIDVNALEILCQEHPIRVVYCIPHHHYPTTVTLCAQRRNKLLELAKKYRFIIIEDDYDYDFQYDDSAYLPLYSLAKEVDIVYVGSFSKVISPYLRIGFLIANATLIKKAYRLRRLINIMGDEIMENTLAALINNGDLSRHIKKTTKIYRERRDYLIQQLRLKLGDQVYFNVPNGGMALWVQFKEEFPLTKAIALAKNRGINFSGLPFTFNHKLRGMRLGFASLDKHEVDEIVDILQHSLADKINSSNSADLYHFSSIQTFRH
ncbi:PLP-dependent aminotransferase family protein [Olivibacter sp. SDN3]|uniref:aminotransferase-like domain-containing protein n=1 Tax=Olivibacter sp. SDN3 TaxID=2764720 RepID=UPI001651228B|nr:PLP-dependent aminotransferase family protein [Olivibacter sp. SDN3]QNL48227.1 PLP-dependent aminotransferase family protein [Olivibacter sp. SDN3]